MRFLAANASVCAIKAVAGTKFAAVRRSVLSVCQLWFCFELQKRFLMCSSFQLASFGGR